MNEEVKVEPVVETPEVETPIVEEVKQPTKNDLLRELSKEHGVNLFDVEGLKKFKDYTESQKTELEKMNETIESFKAKESEWQSKIVEYESKLKASELGIPANMLEDALKLANGDANNLAEVVKKYPAFKTQDGIRIGVQNPENGSNPSGITEAEKYMASNPRVYKK